MNPDAAIRLRERAESAPISLRILCESLQRTLPQDYPDAATFARWEEFPRLGGIASSFLLCVYLTKEVDAELRDELEGRVRGSLSKRWPDSERFYRAVSEYVVDRMAPLSRAQRGAAIFFFACEWVIGVIEDDRAMPRSDEIIATMAQFFMREIPGYWSAVQDYSTN